MIKFMQYAHPEEFAYVMLYDSEDISNELLNFLQFYNEDIFEHMGEHRGNDCLLHGEEVNSIKGFLDVSDVKYESSDEVFVEE